MSDFTSIKIKGKYFEQETTLNFFDDGKVASIIYGKNGSGKSTISKAFNGYKNDETNFDCFMLLNKTNKPSNQIKENIWVFNEDFIDKNIKFSTDGMDAIVMFGESIDIDTLINEYNDKIQVEMDAIKKRNYKQYSLKKGNNNVEESKKKIHDIIKNNWGPRENSISNKNPSITDNVLRTLLEVEKPSKCQKEIRNEFNDLLTRINKSRNSGTKIDLINAFSVSYAKSDLENILNKHYEKKDNSKLATLIYSKMTSNEFNKASFDFMIKDSNDICPTCFQKVDKDWKLNLKRALDEITDEEVKNYKKQLEHCYINMNLNGLPNDVSIFEGVQIAKFNDLNVKLGEKIKEINEFIKVKIENPYINKAINCDDFYDFIEQYNKLIENFNEIIITHNRDIDSIEENIRNIKSINNQLSYFEIHDEKDRYLKLKKEMEDCAKADESSNILIRQYNDEINLLNSKKSCTDIALNDINKDLAFIFTNKNRLYLKSETDSSKYIVYSKGNKIDLNHLSTGERNLISLCYYFNSIKKNKKDVEVYNDEMLLVIDDPISSFDFENKLGILSYIRKISEEIYKKNDKTKFIIFTHDFNIWINLYESFTCFMDGKKVKKSRLYNKQLVNEKNKSYNYQELLLDTFDFANGEVKDDLSIGNTMRRLLEAYSTFNYKIGMTDMFKEKDILAKIKEDKLRDYFSNKLYRIVLNSESHTRDVMISYPDIMTIEQFSIEEKIDVAKNILVYLYCLDEIHIKKHLGENFKIVQNWKEDILKVI